MRLLKPGGLFIGHMLNRKHTTYKKQLHKMDQKEPGTLFLNRENIKEKINLEDIGLTHFFTKSEYKKLLKGCSIINPCESVTSCRRWKLIEEVMTIISMRCGLFMLLSNDLTKRLTLLV